MEIQLFSFSLSHFLFPESFSFKSNLSQNTKKPRELLPREIRVDTGIRTLGLQSHNLAR